MTRIGARTRGIVKAIALVACGAGLAVAPAAVVTGGVSDEDAPAISNLVQQFLQQNVPEALSTGGAQNPPRSPFGNESGLPPAEGANVTLVDTFQFVAQPGKGPGFVDGDFDGTPDIVLGDVVRQNGGAGSDPIGLGGPFQDIVDTGIIPNSGGPPAETLNDFLQQMGLDPNSTEIQDLNGIPVRVIGSPGDLGDQPLANDPVLISGGLVEGNLPLGDDCGGSLIDLGRLDAFVGRGVFDAADFAPEDLFGGGSQAIVGRCTEGSGWTVDRQVLSGGSFNSTGTRTKMVVAPSGWVSVTPLSEIAGTTGHRQFAFTTPAANPFTPSTTAYTSNMLPGLVTSPAHVVVFDPFDGEQRVGVFPLEVEFTGVDIVPGGPCPGQFSQLLEAHVEMGSDGTYPTHLYGFASGQVAPGTATFDGDLQLMAEGSGEGYTEQYDVVGPGGTYTYRPGDGACTYDLRILSGYDAFVNDPAFVVIEPEPEPEPDQPVVVDDEQPAVVVEDDDLTIVVDPVDDEPDIAVDDAGDQAPIILDDDVDVVEDTTGSSSSDGPNWLLIVLGGATAAGGGGMYLRYRKMGPDDVPARLPEQIDEPASVALNEDDLARYAKYGVYEDHSTAQAREQHEADIEAERVRGSAARAAADAERQARVDAILSEKVEYTPRPVPSARNIQLTDNAALAFAFEFVTVMEEDLTSGRSRDRLAEVIVAMPDAFEKAGGNVVQQVQTAYTGWGEIFSNPESLTELDDAAVDAGHGLMDLGERYLEEAEKDSDEFVTMTADLTANLQVQAVLAKGLSNGGTALATRLQGGVAATEATAATGATSGVRPPPVRTGPGSTQVGGPRTGPGSTQVGGPRTGPGSTQVGRPPAAQPAQPPPAQPPVGPMHGPPNPLNGYGPGAARVPLQSGAGTPIQMAPNGCGAAVLRGIFRDFGLAVPSEIDILIRGALQRIGGMRLWNPNGGFNAAGMAQTIRSMMPAGFNVIQRSFAGVANTFDDLAQLVAQNPAGKVMVGLRWRGAFQGGAGHWLRVEAIKNGWVALGDPATGLTIAIPANNLSALAECAIAVVP